MAKLNRIGIRHESKYAPERRSPLVPSDVSELVKGEGISVFVEKSAKRIFSDREYRDAGAEVVDDVSFCDVILGVKEMPEGYFQEGKTYLYFSHVIKGQPQNMPMLRDLMQSGATLIDYERISDSTGRRLIFFGRHAGYAGMINTLWTLGRRLQVLGYKTPFGNIHQAATYDSLEDAKNDIRTAGDAISGNGPGADAGPLIIAVTGDGNVAQGAMEILDLLQVQELEAESLPELRRETLDPNTVYKVNIVAADYMDHREGRPFDLEHFLANPDEYHSRFDRLLPNIDVLVNGIYWDERYPRLVTKSWLRNHDSDTPPRLRVIGDITCDPHGSIECTEKATGIEDPVFIYNPLSDTHTMGFEGPGVAVMAVDILPSDLPRESSEHFSRMLRPWIPGLASADWSGDWNDLALPDVLKKAVIVHRGELTTDYRYLEACLQ